jgi:glycosyltransferase involved in cell wall biosynthesis
MAPNQTPLAAIVVATYNAGRFIGATIESALGQTAGNFELIVVDDGSTDDTLSRVASFRDSRIRIVEQSHQGPVVAMNAGFRIARGEYIGLLDHDDLWHETKLAKHLEVFERHPEVDATFSWSRLIDEHGRDLGPDPARWRGAISFRQLLEANPMGNTSSLVLRRSAVERVGACDPRFFCCYDAYLVLQIARLRPGNVCSVPEELTFYRLHRSQQSRDWRSMEREWLVMLEEFRRTDPELVAALEGRATSRRRCWYAFQAYRGGEFPAACRLAAQALCDAPGFFLTNPWSWKVSAACLSGLLLPAAIHRRLERAASARTT